jgi:hypothetical protein
VLDEAHVHRRAGEHRCRDEGELACEHEKLPPAIKPSKRIALEADYPHY